MQMGLSPPSSGRDPLLEDPLSFLDKLPVEIDCVLGDAPRGVVFTEDVVGGLVVVLVHQGGVTMAFFGERFGGCAIAAGVGLVGLSGLLAR